jgi:hypothetical protein
MRSFILVVVAMVAVVACKDENATTTSGTVTSATSTAATTGVTATATAAATAAPTAAAVTVSPDMTAFMAMLDGKDGSARKALKKYGSKAVEGDDLGMYMLQNPKVTKSSKAGDAQCYTMESEAGVMKHVTEMCWDAKGKISKITDTSS